MSMAEEKPLPGSLQTNRRLDRWIRFGDDRVAVRPGKVEIGQGVVTALAQVAAEELDVALERIVMIPADTAASPNEGMTAGSQSIEQSGEALRYACAEVRDILLQEAARRFGVSLERLSVDDGVIRVRGETRQITYWELPSAELLAREASAQVRPKAAAEFRLVGRPVPRRDIPAKVSGAAYVHDIELPGMLHGRVLRPATYRANLTAFDDAAVRSLPGVVALVRDGSFVGIVAEREEQAVTALRVAAQHARWDEPNDLPDPARLHEDLARLPIEDSIAHEKTDAQARQRGRRTLEAVYTKPYIAHAAIGPSCALARFDAGRYEIWCHSQGIFPLRTDLAKVLQVEPADIVVRHADGAGCYGHNGADDAALDAALLARALPGRPVRVQWMREDEFAWEPYGPAMRVAMAAALDDAGNIVDWTHDLWSNPHSGRPGRHKDPALCAAWSLEGGTPQPPGVNVPLPQGGSHRNAVPLYDFPNQRVGNHLITTTPIRVSSLRSLGGYANVFAIECFMDELAALAGADPVEFRLRHLRDPRARAVLETVARKAGWKTRERGDGSRGRGVGFCKYKNLGSYCAVIAEVSVEEALRVPRVWAAVDVGRSVNPDGVVNQIEGGVVQSTSWTLKEQVRFDRSRILSRSWEDYPILSFTESPQVEVTLIDRPEEASKGAGEGAQGPTAAAIANALANALGVRVRDLPLTPERIRAAIG